MIASFPTRPVYYLDILAIPCYYSAVLRIHQLDGEMYQKMKLIKGVLLVVLVLFIATIGVCQATENSATPELKRISYSRDGSVRSGFSQSGEYWVSRDAGTTWKKEPKPQDMGEILVLAAATAIFSWLGWLGIKSLYYKVTGKEPEEPYYESTPGGFQ